MQIKVLICLVVLAVLGLCQINQNPSQNTSKVLGGVSAYKPASDATATMIEANNFARTLPQIGNSPLLFYKQQVVAGVNTWLYYGVGDQIVEVKVFKKAGSNVFEVKSIRSFTFS